MPLISSQDAAQIARRHGLTLSDAAAIGRMAETIEEGTALAKLFSEPPQLSREQVQSMSPEAILEAKAAGQCDNLLSSGGKS